MSFSSPLVGSSSSKLELNKSPFILSPVQRKNSVIIRLLCKVKNLLEEVEQNESLTNLDDIFHEAFDNLNISDDDNLLISSLSSSNQNNNNNKDGGMFFNDNDEDVLNLDYLNEEVLTNIIEQLMKKKSINDNNDKKEVVEDVKEDVDKDVDTTTTTTTTTAFNTKSRGLTPRKFDSMNSMNINTNTNTPLKTPTRLAKQRAEKKKNFDIQVDKENQVLLSKIDSKSSSKSSRSFIQKYEESSSSSNAVELLL